MRALFLLAVLFFGACFPVEALTVKGIAVEPSVKVGDQVLQLNGYGLRKMYFFNIYLGSFYTSSPVHSAVEAVKFGDGRLIRMNFIYSRASRLNVLGAFAEGIHHNYPSLSGSAEEKAFLSWFQKDFLQGDVVDLAIDRDGTVTAYQNFQQIGTLHSPELAKGILLIYFGKQPADEDMKAGMLKGLG